MAFLTGGIWKKEDFFLKSSRQESRSLYQISNNNPQKDNFHDLVFLLTKDRPCG